MRLYRIAAVAAYVCAVLLVVNVLRRAGVVPETALTHAIAPFGALTGLFAITGLYLLIRGSAGNLGLVGYLLNSAGLAGAFAIEYALHFIFPSLDGATVTGLLAGGTGMAFLVTSVVLVAGVLTFGAAALRSGLLPPPGVALYVVGMIPGSLRSALPAPVYLIGLVVAAAGIVWMATRLWSAEDDPGMVAASGAVAH
ncbi:hypothetical protein LDL08_31880 [Nonomuraea glycinis]|uniref:Uncharacterized protein n=1 Tax=Nonomuraea glycinis TaxID=2047744 RepID=A0A918E6Z6_9ACTN|nr:hypothetical protein [Nonomuraea glycinis]MCA2180789.1 hypothetical protein [Nonomuraea glycinis]GGP11706.1 hypothetical protein GCM10012278_56540 [Nonomuraea glycinis]